MEETVGNIPPGYDKDKVYKTAFGHIRLPYPLLVAQSRTIGVNPLGKLRALKGSFKLQSQLGVEYALPTIIDGWQLPGEPIITITGGKNIKETTLNRGDRTQNVLEEINLNNYRIRLRGIILSDEDIYPEFEVRRLRELVEKPGNLRIENGLTNIWNISKVVITDWDMFEVEGFLGAQAFQLDLLSDQDFELEVTEDAERL